MKVSLRVKLTFAFIVLTALLSGGLSVFNYLQLRSQLMAELTNKLTNIAFLGAQLLDKPSFALLATRIDRIKSNETGQPTIEKTPQYAKIYEQLNFIRDSSPKLIKYIYTFVPGKSDNEAYYVVDANTLNLVKRSNQGLPTEDISHFNSPFDISTFPTASLAMQSRKVSIEKNFSYDANFQTHILTGYAPIMGGEENQCLGFLGVDISAKDVDDLLSDSVRNSLYMTAIVVVLSILISVYFGRFLTKTLVALDHVVNQFTKDDFSARVKVSSADEVGRLGYSLNQMAEIIENSRLRLGALLEAYGKFVPQEYIRLLGKSDIVELKLGDYLQKQMTVLFTDIRGFTTLSEKMSPYENFAFINSFLKRMGPIVRNNSGIIDKYIGDAIMALFNDQPEFAVNAAVQMFEELDNYNQHRRDQLYDPIDMGIGIHTGSIMVGTVGEQERMDGTVIGDSVNFASRLESLTKTYGAHILISEATVRLLPNRNRYKMRFLDRVIVKGKSEQIPILEILDGKKSNLNLKKIELTEEFESAVLDFHSNRQEAQGKFQRLFEKNPEDLTIQLYLNRCEARAHGYKVAGVDQEYKKKA
ncbi:MAG: adenylate/guanylate cyclase domain-containing protein [Spirochaetes bacterium]|nr:adenylate/guanylate cyclase domain-containing protein [Spirochaetota bacterium]